MKYFLALTLLILTCTGCSHSNSYSTENQNQFSNYGSQNQTEDEYSEDDLIFEDEDEEYYDNEDEGLYFHGYECTEDCSGHEAGYAWAEEKDIDDLDNCGGKSQSFIEGCQAYVEENY